jgi:hypothetical protein
MEREREIVRGIQRGVCNRLGGERQELKTS